MDTSAEGRSADLEQAKLRLEQEKLRLEIDHLARTWWRKPTTYIGVVLPITAALTTIAAGLWSGYFQNEYKVIELRRLTASRDKEQLERDKVEFEKQREVFRAEKLRVEEEHKMTLQRERQRYEDALRDTAVAGERQLARLRGELQSTADLHLTVANVALLRELVENRSPLPVAAIRDVITALRRASNDRLAKLIEQELIHDISKRFDKSGPRTLGAYLLYQGTNQFKWRDALFSGVLSFPYTPRGEDGERFWSVLPQFEWSDDDRVKLYMAVCERSKLDADREYTYPLTRVIRPRHHKFSVTKSVANHRDFGGFLIRMRTMSFTPGLRTFGLQALGGLVPQAAVIYLGVMVARGDWRGLSNAGLPEHADTAILQGVATQLGAPNIVESLTGTGSGTEWRPMWANEWKAWIERRRDLVELWMEDNLTRVRTHPSLLEGL